MDRKYMHTEIVIYTKKNKKRLTEENCFETLKIDQKLKKVGKKMKKKENYQVCEENHAAE